VACSAGTIRRTTAAALGQKGCLAAAAHEHAFGAIGHTATGLAGGFLSGAFLQTLAVTMVTGTGTLNEPRPAEIFMIQALTGLAAGAIARLVVGFIKHTVDQHKASKG
jgi:hypothetical protein